eukprot:m.21709 g.21709  ORF g.21709 m.21709 type:complete len:700 (+) comp28205_c0_seq1:32-2131(+)
MNDVVLEGYMQKCPQKPGAFKSWNKRWFVLRQAGPLGSARLEYYVNPGKARRQQGRRIIPLREVTSLNQTMHKEMHFVFDILTPVLHYRLSVPNQHELDNWLAAISDIAFGDNPQGITTGSPPPAYGAQEFSFNAPNNFPESQLPSYHPPPPQHHPPVAMPCPEDNPFLMQNRPQGIQENTLYSSMEVERKYRVTIIPTDASSNLRLVGEYFLAISSLNITLVNVISQEILCVWPLKYLRRYGRDYTKFTFEAGRKCETGPGVFYFGTQLGNEIFHQVHNNVKEIGSQQHRSLRQSEMADPNQSPSGDPMFERTASVMHTRPAVPDDRARVKRSSSAGVSTTKPIPPQLAYFAEVTISEKTQLKPTYDEAIPPTVDDETKHYYEREERIEADSLAPVTPYDTLFAGPDGNFQIAQQPENSRRVPTKPKRRSNPGYDRLAPAKVTSTSDGGCGEGDGGEETLYEDADLDQLMAGLAQHAEATISPYNTFGRELPMTNRKSSVERPAPPPAMASKLPANRPSGKPSSITIDNEELSFIDSILSEMTVDDTTVPRPKRGDGARESAYDMPRKMPFEDPSIGKQPYSNVSPDTALAVGNPADPTKKRPYHNIEFPAEEGLGSFEGEPTQMYYNVEASGVDEGGMFPYMNVNRDGGENGDDSDAAYTEVAMDDIFLNRIKREQEKMSMVDDPAYGVPVTTNTAQ